MMRACAFLSIALVTTAPLPVASGEGEGEGEGEGPTYFADMKPLIEQKCLACHVDGGIAPFALTAPEDVIAMASFLADAVESLVMPPWPFAPVACDARRHLSH